MRRNRSAHPPRPSKGFRTETNVLIHITAPHPSHHCTHPSHHCTHPSHHCTAPIAPLHRPRLLVVPHLTVSLSHKHKVSYLLNLANLKTTTKITPKHPANPSLVDTKKKNPSAQLTSPPQKPNNHPLPDIRSLS